ncbi:MULTISPECIES: hypothetical protein [unclassified Streptomyces]|nr:hypothetical protein [Streptomyces sp. NRRL F-2747]
MKPADALVRVVPVCMQTGGPVVGDADSRRYQTPVAPFCVRLLLP